MSTIFKCCLNFIRERSAQGKFSLFHSAAEKVEAALAIAMVAQVVFAASVHSAPTMQTAEGTILMQPQQARHRAEQFSQFCRFTDSAELLERSVDRRMSSKLNNYRALPNLGQHLRILIDGKLRQERTRMGAERMYTSHSGIYAAPEFIDYLKLNKPSLFQTIQFSLDRARQ